MNRVPMESRVNLAIRANMEKKEIKESQETPVHLEIWDFKECLGKLAQPDHQESKETLDYLDPKEILVLWDPLAYKVLQETKENPALKDPMA